MNELEMFEAYMKKEHPFIDTVNGAYEAMWNLWQARVPEGYVVVPKLPTENMINSGLETECGIDDWTIIHDIYQSMIEAVEK